MQVQSLGPEDSLEEEMATCILDWRITWTEEPGRLQFISSQSVRLSMHAHTAWPLGFLKALPVILVGSKV